MGMERGANLTRQCLNQAVEGRPLYATANRALRPLDQEPLKSRGIYTVVIPRDVSWLCSRISLETAPPSSDIAMQNTRFNRLVEDVTDQATRWLKNPWRRLSFLVIGLLFGIFLALVVSTTAGQTAEIDVVVASFLVLTVELISWATYRRQSPADIPPSRPYWLLDILNALKIGFIYGMFIQAQLLGS